eukprot:TRINITY_DN73581_c0_g1_i1.p1 TRINITY_DN73581_c0_g1~~TRINITY_DN73581_c0_g1_i1.p1  ORF type:complete len:607 (-),score=116.70 TRINITY_DN73581_c0_g1_i1:299-2119(-)
MAARSVGSLPPCGFMVLSEKSGQLPILTERRAKGKRVTVISGVCGNARALCTTLTTLLGVGGTVQPRGPKLSDVEVQGEQVSRVSQALGQLGCVRGPGGSKPAPAVVERDCAYDEFLREQPAGNRKKERWDKSKPPVLLHDPPEDAPCRKWHGHWIYCKGCCTPVNFNDVLLDTMAHDSHLLKIDWDDKGRRLDFEVALQDLGMSAIVGAAVESYRAELAAEAAKRAAPKASFCAPRPYAASQEGVPLLCKECGAAFTMKRTLDMHMRQHRRERQAATLSTEAHTDMTSWRGTSFADKEQEELDYMDSFCTHESIVDEEQLSAEAAEYLVPRASAGTSLASWIEAASSHRDRRLGNSSAVGCTVACPVCGEYFPESNIEVHVDLCLSMNSAQAEGGIGDSSDYDDEELSGELLESLLQLQLPSIVTEHFWSTYEHLASRAHRPPLREVFLSALEQTLSSMPNDADTLSGSSASVAVLAPAGHDDVATCPACQCAISSRSLEQHVELCLLRSTSAAREDVLPEEEALAAELLEQAEAEVAISEPATKTAPRDATGGAVRRWERKCKNSMAAVVPDEEASPSESAADRIKRMKEEAKARKAAARAKQS